jgi:iron complex outermembrane receptor protein
MTRSFFARPAWTRRALGSLRFTTSTWALVAIVAAPLFVASHPSALAAEADQKAKDQAAVSGLPEITVTARYRQENLQTTPIAITAISGEMLKSQSLTNVSDLGLVIPNSNIRQQGNIFGPNPQIGLRGVNTTDFIYTSEPGVAVYIDDVYHGTLSGSAMDLLDLERVEVLRGPQGTLFGKNSLGGAIRLFSKTPKGDDTGWVEATYGTSHRLDIRGGFDFALADNLFMRVTGAAKQIDGYEDMIDYTCQMIANGTPQLAGSLPELVPSNKANQGNCKIGQMGGSSSKAARIMLRYLPMEKLEINLSADYSRTVTQPQPESFLSGRDPNGFPEALYDAAVIFPTYGIHLNSDLWLTGDPFKTYANYSDPLTGKRWPTDGVMDVWGATGKVDWDITDGVHMKTIAAYRTYESDWASDGDGTPFDLNTTLNLQHHQQTSIEVNFTGGLFDNKVQWTTGGFYFSSKSVLGGYVTFGSLAWFGLIPNFAQNDHFTDKSKSLFGHVVWDITNKLSFDGGVRWTSESKTYTFDHTNFLTIATPLNYGTTHVDWKASLDYKFTADQMVYAMVSTGFRSDGAQPRPWTAAQLLPVPGERIRAYEVGAKTDFFENHLRANLSAFLNDYNPRVALQFGEQCNLATDSTTGPFYPLGTTCPAGTPLAGGSGLFWFDYFSAPGKAKGVELELTAEPIDNLVLNGSGGFYTYSSSGSVAPGTAGYVDPTAREQPRLTFSAGAQYTLPLGDLGSLTPRLDMFYQGRRTNGNSQYPQVPGDNDVPAYTLFNARITYTSNDRKWSASISAENLFDKFYWDQLTAKTDNTPGPTFGNTLYTRNGVPGRPREFAFTIRRNF